MRSLSCLPDELIALIASFLRPLDVESFRNTSSDVEKATFDHFARHFFRKKGFMIVDESLTVLEDIASHPGLKTYVQHIWFNPDCFTFVKDSPQFISKTSEVIRRYQSDHRALLNDPTLSLRLEKIFQAFPNLKTVGMRRGTEHKPWGWAKLQYAAGQDPRRLGAFAKQYPHMILEPSLLFMAILRSFANGRNKVKRFYTDTIIEKGIVGGLSIDDIRAACWSIQYIELNLVGSLPEFFTSSRAREVDSPELPGALLRDMLQCMPDLTELGLTLFHDSTQRHMVPPVQHDLQSWRDTYAYKTLHLIGVSVHLTQLRRVKLEKVCTTASTLISILRPSAPLLMSLKLRHIHLLSEQHDREEHTVEHDRPWRVIFSFMADDCEALEYVLLHWLTVDGTTVRFQQDITAASREHTGSIDLIETSIPALGQAPAFADYDNLTIEVFNREDVRKRIQGLVDAHWSGTRLVTYTMDEDIWHTDTSEEEW